MPPSSDANQPDVRRRRPLRANSIDANPARLVVYETRLALSASLAAEWLLPQLVQDPLAQTADEGSLLDQAQQVRDEYGISGSEQTVAVIDSGIAWDHVALGAGFGPGYRVVGGWDFAEDDANPYDDGPVGFHGSHVSGLLAGQADDFEGMVPEADLVALRVFDDAGQGNLASVESALQWVHENRETFAHPITAVNLSLGANLTDATGDLVIAQLQDELQLLRDDGIVVVGAAGNLFDANYPDRVTFPAQSPLVAAVGSVDADGSLSFFSQREEGILTAPGVQVVSSVPEHILGWDGKIDDYTAASGTSMAAPQIAGAAALVREAMLLADPNANVEPQTIIDHLHETAIQRSDQETDLTYHIVDLVSAIDSLLADLPGQGVGQPEPPAPPALPDFIHFENGQLQVIGTDQGDRISIHLDEGLSFEVNGVAHTISQERIAQIERIHIDGGNGNDFLKIVGSTQSERLILSAPEGNHDRVNELIAEKFVTQMEGFEEFQFLGGGGSADRATLFDSFHDDRLEARPGTATLSGTGYSFAIEDVPKIYVHATAGGEDSAFLRDSTGDDILAVRPQFSSLRGDQHFSLAYGFERVYAYATAGGHDSASIYDSAGDDRMTASTDTAFVSGPEYYASARYFEHVTATATAGGNDRATLYAADDSVTWHRTSSHVQMDLSTDSETLQQHTRIARGFLQTETYVGGQQTNWTPLGFQITPLNHLNDALPTDFSSESDEITQSSLRAALLTESFQPNRHDSSFVLSEIRSRLLAERLIEPVVQPVSEGGVLANLFAELDDQKDPSDSSRAET